VRVKGHFGVAMVLMFTLMALSYSAALAEDSHSSEGAANATEKVNETNASLNATNATELNATEIENETKLNTTELENETKLNTTELENETELNVTELQNETELNATELQNVTGNQNDTAPIRGPKGRQLKRH
jgi:hypothetical protein